MKTKTSGRFDVDDPYKPGMKFDVEWSQGKKAAYNAARKRYHHTGAKAALEDKVNEDKIAELKTALKRWEAKRDQAE